jgi:hypothetical protein
MQSKNDKNSIAWTGQAKQESSTGQPGGDNQDRKTKAEQKL